MILSIQQCRKMLGEKYKNYTDEQIQQILDFMYRFAEYNVQIINQVRSKAIPKRKKR